VTPTTNLRCIGAASQAGIYTVQIDILLLYVLLKRARVQIDDGDEPPQLDRLRTAPCSAVCTVRHAKAPRGKRDSRIRRCYRIIRVHRILTAVDGWEVCARLDRRQQPAVATSAGRDDALHWEASKMVRQEDKRERVGAGGIVSSCVTQVPALHRATAAPDGRPPACRRPSSPGAGG
jgi:hypothetical protein